MRSNNFKDKELLQMIPDMEGVTRPKRKSKTKKFKLVVKDVGKAPMKLTTYAETEAKAIQYVKARWKDCIIRVI